MNETIFDKLDFGPLKPLLDNDDITDISYCNGGQIWIRSLTQGSIRVEVPGCTQEFMEKLAFQCSNVMGTTFNNAKPFLDAESSELRLNFVHQSIATNGIACVLRKTPAKIRLNKEKLMEEDYFTADIHDFLIKCVQGHCNIIVCGETGSGKTEFVKYLASHTKENEKIITIEDTLELHLDKIYPHRDIVSMKTNNVASYSDVLVTCMRQNPKWILLSEVRSAEAVSAVRNSISSGHNILSTIHADKASAIPYRLYSLMETDLDVDQFLTTIYRYIQLGVHIKAYYSKKYGKFHRELDEVTEFYVDDNNLCQSNTIYRKLFDKEAVMVKPSAHLLEYLSNQNIDVTDIVSHLGDQTLEEKVEDAESDSDDTSIPETIASVPVQQEEKTVETKDLGYSVMSDPSGEKLETPTPTSVFNGEGVPNENTQSETEKVEQPNVENSQASGTTQNPSNQVDVNQTQGEVNQNQQQANADLPPVNLFGGADTKQNSNIVQNINPIDISSINTGQTPNSGENDGQNQNINNTSVNNVNVASNTPVQNQVPENNQLPPASTEVSNVNPNITQPVQAQIPNLPATNQNQVIQNPFIDAGKTQEQQTIQNPFTAVNPTPMPDIGNTNQPAQNQVNQTGAAVAVNTETNNQPNINPSATQAEVNNGGIMGQVGVQTPVEQQPQAVSQNQGGLGNNLMQAPQDNLFNNNTVATTPQTDLNQQQQVTNETQNVPQQGVINTIGVDDILNGGA